MIPLSSSSTGYSNIEETGALFGNPKVYEVAIGALMVCVTLNHLLVTRPRSTDLRSFVTSMEVRSSKEESITWKSKEYISAPIKYHSYDISSKPSNLTLKLRAIRERAISKGMPLLSLDEINNELRSIRGS